MAQIFMTFAVPYSSTIILCPAAAIFNWEKTWRNHWRSAPPQFASVWPSVVSHVMFEWVAIQVNICVSDRGFFNLVSVMSIAF